MPLYLAATPDRLTRARAVTPRLAHVAYRLGPGSELLAAPLPPALRGGLMVLSDWDCPPVEEPGPPGPADCPDLPAAGLRRGGGGL